MANYSEEIGVGAALLIKLEALGVEFVFTNSGTDFPPIIESISELAAAGQRTPKLVVVPHEHAAMGMAYGYFKMTGSPQAVILHTNVGLSNGATGAINAACENVPILIMSGRTPTTEQGRIGSRTVPIGWGQEMRDQAALVREACKWDYELRFPEQIHELLDRALAIAKSTPKGPVYLSLPREVLCERISSAPPVVEPRYAHATGAPFRSDVSKAAKWIAESNRPMMIAQREVGDKRAFRLLDGIAENWGIAVCNWWATGLAVSTEHPCCVGSDPSPWLEEADLIIVLNSLAPWWPDAHTVNPQARIINMGPDPLFSRFPVRNFKSDLSIAGETHIVLSELDQALKRAGSWDSEKNALRRAHLSDVSEQKREIRRQEISEEKYTGITKEFVSVVLGEVLDGLSSTVFSELGVQLNLLKRTDRNSWFQEPYSGGLGWSLPAAMGAKLAKPTQISVAVMGDGSYIFSNPVACHQVMEALRLPVLVLVLNNEEWGAVRHSVQELYPQGFASRANEVPLTSLSPSPDFTKIAAASRAWNRKVKKRNDLRTALEKGINRVTIHQQPSLIEVKIE